jgi:predicted ATPase
MAILIKATEDKKITISGTGIELSEVYGRIRFLGDYSGTTIQGEVSTFANKETFAEGKILYTDVPIGSYQSELEAGEVQSLETAHKYAKLAYEQMGYEVVIDMTA